MEKGPKEGPNDDNEVNCRPENCFGDNPGPPGSLGV